MAVGHLIPSTIACAPRTEKNRAPNPNPTRPDRSRADPCRSKPDPSPTPARLRSGMARNKIEKNAKTRNFAFRVPAVCLPCAFRVPSGTAPFECAQFRPGSGSLVLLRCDSARLDLIRFSSVRFHSMRLDMIRPNDLRFGLTPLESIFGCHDCVQNQRLRGPVKRSHGSNFRE